MPETGGALGVIDAVAAGPAAAEEPSDGHLVEAEVSRQSRGQLLAPAQRAVTGADDEDVPHSNPASIPQLRTSVRA